MSEAQAPLAVDVVSDVVCPWCFVGKRNLDAALARVGAPQAVVRWRPFQLDPTVPQGGMDRRAYMARKFPPERIAEIHARLVEIGAAAGIPFAFDRIARSPNTLDAHRLIRWAQPSGVQDAVVESLFTLYFVEGADIGDRSVLADVAAAHGLDRAATMAMLEAETDAAAVRDEIASAVRLGVSGVPFFILANRYALSGAQPPEAIASALRKAQAEA